MKKNTHTLRTIEYLNGKLTVLEFHFECLTDAVEASKVYKGIVKIYNYLKQLIWSSCKEEEDVYA